MANQSIYAAFERMRQHIVAALGNKSDVDHTHDTVTDATDGLMSNEDKIKLDKLNENYFGTIQISKEVYTDDGEYDEENSRFAELSADHPGSWFNVEIDDPLTVNLTAMPIPTGKVPVVMLSVDEASTAKRGTMSAEDKIKLDGIQSGAAQVQIISWEAED